MKKIIIASYLLLMSLISSYGQWYVREYAVSDINFLTKEQLMESLKSSKEKLLGSAIIAGVGGVFLAIGKYIPYQLPDNPTILEQIIGENGMNVIEIVIGAAVLAGGSIASVCFLGRIGIINSAIERNNPVVGSLNISPALVLKSCSRSYYPGFRLTVNF